MRLLNKLEKSVVKKLCEESNTPKFVADFLVDILDDCLLSLNREKSTVDIVVFDELNLSGKDREDYLISIMTDTTRRIITVINLLMQLEKEGFLFTGNFSHGIALDPTFGKEPNLKKYNEDGHSIVKWPFTDDSIKNLILNKIDLNVFPTEELNAFVKNKFRTKTDLRHLQSMRIAWIAIIMSFTLGVLSLMLQLLKCFR